MAKKVESIYTILWWRL